MNLSIEDLFFSDDPASEVEAMQELARERDRMRVNYAARCIYNPRQQLILGAGIAARLGIGEYYQGLTVVLDSVELDRVAVQL